ncbi:kelch repeat-containing protein, partial [Xanthomonas maliensis]
MAGLMPRAQHTATVLSDGRLLVAGGIGHPDQAQLWDPETQDVVTLTMPARSGHLATLQADGQVRLSGGTASTDAARRDLLFDPATQTFKSALAGWAAPGETVLAATLPVAKDTHVDPSTRIALRFSRPLRVAEVGDATVALMGPGGSVETHVSTAEGGRLVFIRPTALMFPGT